MTEVGETALRVDTLIKETIAFEKICTLDLARADEIVQVG